MKLIEQKRTIIPACDCNLEVLKKIAIAGAGNKLVGAYKVGFRLGLWYGLPHIVETIRDYDEEAPIIYDHQKAGTDIPDTGKAFAKVCKEAGINSVILFPQAGPVTQEAWIKACQDEGLHVIAGGMMTHPGYTTGNGGYILEDKIGLMYAKSFDLGIRDFVVPGNKPEYIKFIQDLVHDSVFYAPGFITQGGNISESGKVAGDKFHAIIGRGITQADDIRVAITELTSHIKQLL